MRTRAVIGSIFGSIVVLVAGWQVGIATTNSSAPTNGSTAASGSPDTSTTSSGGATETPSSTTSPAPSNTSNQSGTFVGSTVQTRFGPMQVEVLVTENKITDVKTLQLTNQGGRSVQISNYAVPILRKEVLAAQSAKVSSVSGATYTSEGYLSSLQSALDKAGL